MAAEVGVSIFSGGAAPTYFGFKSCAWQSKPKLIGPIVYQICC